MSEPKRVLLTAMSSTIGGGNSVIDPATRKSLFQGTEAAFLEAEAAGSATQISVSNSQKVVGGSSGNKQLDGSKPSIRFTLDLFEPDAYTYPDFSFSKLLEAEKKKPKFPLKSNGGIADPFDDNDNDDDVARIAKEFEKKYGNSTTSDSSKGKRNQKRDDYYDIGAGYDVNDSFIDNTEAYDEIIPEEVEPDKGGFYINCGDLKFNILSNLDRPDDIIKMPKSKKRTLSLSSSDSEENEDSVADDKEDDLQVIDRVDEMPAKDEMKLKNGQSDVKKPKFEEKELVVNQSKPKKDKKLEKAKSLKDDSSANEGPLSPDPLKVKEKVVKTTTIKDMLKAKRDNFRKMQESGEGKLKLNNGEYVKSSAGSSDESSDESSESEIETEPAEKKLKKSMSLAPPVEEKESNKMRTRDVKLPQGLSEDVYKDVQELIDYGISMIKSGKQFVFDDKATEIFLRIVEFCCCLDKTSKNQAYAHIEFRLNLPKYCLLRKSKPLRIKQEKAKTKRAYTKLRKAVNEVMPSVLQSYEINYKKVDETRTMLAQTDIVKSDALPKFPKKKFPWNDSFRNLLYELYQVRWTSYAVLGNGNEPFNEFVDKYLKETVVPIWPIGWMRYEELQKELEKRKLAANKPKENKKPIDSLIKTPSSSSNKKKTTEDGSASLSATSQKLKTSNDICKPILASNNTMSVVSTKDLVVKFSTTKTTEKKSEVPNGGSSDANVKSSNSCISASSEIKAKKSTEQSTSGLIVIEPKNITKATQLLSSDNSSICSSRPESPEANIKIEKNQTDGNSNEVVAVITCSPSASKGAKLQDYLDFGLIDLTSPTKRATDHSISTIMSLTSPTETAATSPTGSSSRTPPPPVKTINHSSVISNPKTSTVTAESTAKTHILNVDNLKSTSSDILNKKNHIMKASNSEKSSQQLSRKTNSTSSSSVRNKPIIMDIRNELKKELEISETSSESDGVEIVGVFPAARKKKLCPQQQRSVNRLTLNKSNNNSSNSSQSRSSSPINTSVKIKSSSAVASSNSKREYCKKSSNPISFSVDNKETDSDHVNQTMKALKELQSM